MIWALRWSEATAVGQRRTNLRSNSKELNLGCWRPAARHSLGSPQANKDLNLFCQVRLLLALRLLLFFSFSLLLLLVFLFLFLLFFFFFLSSSPPFSSPSLFPSENSGDHRNGELLCVRDQIATAQAVSSHFD